jgi:RNA polymerase sigma factor (sigma-70 family)
MLRALGKQRPVDYHEAVFLSRYEQIHSWARQLAKGNEAEAEDLVQDAFVDFIHSRPDLSGVRNLDAFLYAIVRNIHRSQLQRHLRRRNLLLSVVDYDSADLGLNAAAPGRLLEVREQLHRVCQFACERKRTSKAGSLLILRFFHGYYPAEIAAITRWDRATVDARMALVRREARSYVEGPEPNRPALPTSVDSEAVLAELRCRILSAVEGDCLPHSTIRKLYRSEALEGPGREFLSHLVSCPRCLDLVSRMLGLDGSSERGFGESDGPQPPGPRKAKPGVAPPIGKWRRKARTVFEHDPRELMIVVNGSPLAWQTVASESNEFSVRLPLHEPIEFVEVFSEQDVRLLSLAVPGEPPEVDLELRNEIGLSNGRSICLILRFETLGPEIRLSYLQPARSETPVPLPVPPDREPAALNWRNLFRPRLALWGVAFAALLILLRPARQTTVSAAELLVKVRVEERSVIPRPGLVAHRSLRLEERLQGRPGILRSRRVEIWYNSQGGPGIRRLYDERGTLLASSNDATTARPSSEEDAWKYEPSAENFELLAGDLSHVDVAEDRAEVRLTAPSTGLVIRKDRWHAIEGFLVISGHEFRFTETTLELVRSEASPLTVAPQPAAKIAAIKAPQPDLPSAAHAPDLEIVEVDSRYALHQIGADTGYPIEIRRRNAVGHAELLVSGVVPSAERRAEIERALGGLPAVALELKTEEEISLEALPPARNSAEIHVASARSPIEKQLLQYFGKPADVEQFKRNALAADEKLMAHVWALDRLSRRYPSPPLDPGSRGKLEEIRSDHQRLLRDALREVIALVEPVLVTVTSTPESAPSSKSTLHQAQRIDQLMIALLSGSGPAGAAAQDQPDAAVRELLGIFRNLPSESGHDFLQ